MTDYALQGEGRLAYWRYYCGVFHAEAGLSSGRRFETLREVRAFVDSVTALPAWTRLQRFARVTVEPSERSSRPDFERGGVALHADHYHEQALLHQLAHLAVGPLGLHGAPFRRAYLRLTGAVRGERAESVLASGFTAERLPLWAAHDAAAAAHGLEWAKAFAETIRPRRVPALSDYCARSLDVFALGGPRRP